MIKMTRWMRALMASIVTAKETPNPIRPNRHARRAQLCLQKRALRRNARAKIRDRKALARMTPRDRARTLTARWAGKKVAAVSRADLRAARKAGIHDVSERDYL